MRYLICLNEDASNIWVDASYLMKLTSLLIALMGSQKAVLIIHDVESKITEWIVLSTDVRKSASVHGPQEFRIDHRESTRRMTNGLFNLDRYQVSKFMMIPLHLYGRPTTGNDLVIRAQ